MLGKKSLNQQQQQQSEISFLHASTSSFEASMYPCRHDTCNGVAPVLFLSSSGTPTCIMKVKAYADR